MTNPIQTDLQKKLFLGSISLIHEPGWEVLKESDLTAYVGFVSVWEQDAIPFIHNLFVAQNHQRKGIGELLIQSLLDWLPLPYRLKCVFQNKGALAFYHKHGWVEIGRGIGEDGEYLLLELPSGGAPNG